MIHLGSILFIWILVLCPIWALSADIGQSLEFIELRSDDFQRRAKGPQAENFSSVLLHDYELNLDPSFSLRKKQVFEVINIIDWGNEADVYLALNSKAETVALKIIREPDSASNAVPVMAAGSVESDLIPMKYYTNAQGDTLAVEMPFLDDFNYKLSTIVSRHGEKALRVYAYKLLKDIVSQLLILHKHGMYHGDLKEANIAWDSTQAQFKLIDLDNPSLVGRDVRAYAGHYFPNFSQLDRISDPEYGLTADLHALGVVFDEMKKVWSKDLKNANFIERFHLKRAGRLGRILKLVRLPFEFFRLNERTLWFDYPEDHMSDNDESRTGSRWDGTDIGSVQAELPRMTIKQYKQRLAGFLGMPKNTSLVELAEALVAWAQIQMDKNPCNELVAGEAESQK